MSQEYVLERRDTVPLRFTGELLGEVLGNDAPDRFARWHEIRIYKTDSGKFVVEVVFESNATNSKGVLLEPAARDVFICQSPNEVLTTLEDYDPTQYLAGYPIGVDNFKAKNKRLYTQVEDTFVSQVGDVLMQASKSDDRFVESI